MDLFSSYGGQKRSSDALGLEMKKVLRCVVGAKNGTKVLGKEASALNCSASPTQCPL